MSRIYRWPIAVALALAVAAPASAQQIPDRDVGVAPFASAMQALAPVISLGPETAFESAAASEIPLAVAPVAMSRSQSVPLMVVGGAALIVGSLIDGDTGTIIMVGGGVLGLVGLFQYLR